MIFGIQFVSKIKMTRLTSEDILPNFDRVISLFLPEAFYMVMQPCE